MLVYNILLAGVSLLGLLLCWKNRSRTKDTIFILISFLALATLSAIRYDIGYDYTYIYCTPYEEVLADPSIAFRWEPGFEVLMRIIARFSSNYQMLFVVTSVITVGLVLLFFWIYSPNVFISVFLFIALSHYYCSFNFLRQMIAAAIALFALPLVKKRNLLGTIGYFAIVLLAATFHKSALILIPFFFVLLIPFNRYTFLAYSAVTVLIYLNTNRIIEFITRHWYGQYTLENKHMQAAFEFQFAIAVAVIFLLVFLFSKQLRLPDPRNYVYISCAFFTFFFVLMGTRHSILDRLSMYFEMAAPLAIAIIVHQLANARREELALPFAVPRRAVLAGVLSLVFAGGTAIHWYALRQDYHEVTPYRTVFQQPFYASYVEGLKEEREKEKAPEDPPALEPEDVEEIPLPDSSGSYEKDYEIQADPDAPEGMPVEVPFDEF